MMNETEIVVDEMNAPRIWWVSQGLTIEAAAKAGVIWAPQRDKRGSIRYHWESFREVQPGDIILHYANSAVRYVSRVISRFEEAEQPSYFGTEWQGRIGYLVKTEYYSLMPIIRIEKFNVNLLAVQPDKGPLDSFARAKQAYLLYLNAAGLRVICESQSETKWPEFVQQVLSLEQEAPKRHMLKVDKEMNDEKNIILYGPPGTGKTYGIVDEALLIIDREKYAGIVNVPEKRQEAQNAFKGLVAQHRIGFCTFHQSFGYEEFVEGWRSQSNGSFDVADGIFKDMCNAAISSTTPSVESYHFDENNIEFYKMSVGSAFATEGEDFYQYCLDKNVIALGWGGEIDYTKCGSIEDIKNLYNQTYPEESSFGPQAVHRFKNLMKKNDIVLVSEGNRKIRAIAKVTGEYVYDPNTEIAYNHFRAVQWLVKDMNIPVQQVLREKVLSQQTIYQFYKRDLLIDNIKDLLSVENKSSEPQNFVLIIDEINRGNISKVFGELITLIEPDKRIGGENEIRVQLPYSKDSFGVPQNLYLLGTMNTADRSIALIDTALRRRFCFKELMPQYNLLAQNIDGVDVQQLLKTMNDRIEYLFDRDHLLGHAYFIHAKTAHQIIETMQKKIIPLLQEYFYEDWEKIALVLGGAGKTGAVNEKSYFLTKEVFNPEQLFSQVDDMFLANEKMRYKLVDEPQLEAILRIYRHGQG